MHHTTKLHRKNRVLTNYISALDDHKCSVSGSDQFTLWKNVLATHWTGERMDRRTCMKVVASIRNQTRTARPEANHCKVLYYKLFHTRVHLHKSLVLIISSSFIRRLQNKSAVQTQIPWLYFAVLKNKRNSGRLREQIFFRFDIYPIPSANIQKYLSLIPLCPSPRECRRHPSAPCPKVSCSESVKLPQSHIYFSQTKSTNRHVLDMLPT
jgi:hypothetical protein